MLFDLGRCLPPIILTANRQTEKTVSRITAFRFPEKRVSGKPANRQTEREYTEENTGETPKKTVKETVNAPMKSPKNCRACTEAPRSYY